MNKDTKKLWEKLSDDLHELEDWELEFHSRFGGEKFFPYIAPSNVREFFSHLLATQRQELEAYQGKQKRVWYQKGYQEGLRIAKHDLKEQVLEAVGEPIEIKIPLTINYTDREIKKLLTENELREEIKERIEAVFEKEV